MYKVTAKWRVKNKDILDNLYCVENDVSAILENREFSTRIHPEE